MKYVRWKSTFLAAAAILACFSFAARPARAITLNFGYTGGTQTWVVPTGVSSVQIRAWGAQGGSNYSGIGGPSSGGRGAYAQGTIGVSPGQTLYIRVGGQGRSGTSGGGGGFNGGGSAGFTPDIRSRGGGGGGASDVRVNSLSLGARRVVAGGGGGAAGDRVGGSSPGGGGGGGAGYYGGGGGGAHRGLGGRGGSWGSGGAGGAGSQWSGSPITSSNGQNGGFGFGGRGGASPSGNQASSYPGGVGGSGGSSLGQTGSSSPSNNWAGGGGGGGSSRALGASGVSYSSGVQSGNGFVQLNFTRVLPPRLAVTPSVVNYGNVLVGTSRTLGVTARNVGPSGSLLSGTFSGVGGDFSSGASSSFGPLPAGATSTRGYTYTPSTVGSDGATVVVSSNGGTRTSRLQGNGVAPRATWNGSGAGDVRVGTSGSAAVNIRNIGNGNTNSQGIGSASNLRGSVGSLSGEFAGAGGGFSLTDGSAASFSYTYTPTARGFDSAGVGINFVNGRPDGTNLGFNTGVTLTGRGVGPVYQSSPGTPAANDPGSTTMITFANVDSVLGPDQTTATLTITNGTTDGDLGQLTDLSLLGAMITGVDMDQFEIDFANTVLAAGESATFELTFSTDNGINGLRTALLEIKTDQNAAFGAMGDSFFYQLKGIQNPEPGSVLLWSMIGAGAYFYRRRRQQSDATAA